MDVWTFRSDSDVAGVTLDFKGDPAHLERAIVKLEAEMAKLRAEARGVGAAGKKSGDEITAAFGGAADKLIGMVASYATISTVVSKMGESHEVWLKNIREIGEEAKKAVGQYMALAAMQAPGERNKAVMAAANMAAAYGITDRGAGLDVIQGLQSSLGRTKGLESSAAVFAAHRLGVSLAAAKEAEVQGKSLGLEPGENLRRGYIVGQISPRSPEEVIKAAPALRQWDDNYDAWAAAGVISASVNPEELETYVRAAGIGLSGVEDKEFNKWLKKTKFAGGGQMDKLRHLHAQGIDTPAEMSGVGIGEMRRAQSMAALAKNFPDVLSYREQIIGRDRPGLLESELRGVEKEMPGATEARQIAILDAKYANEKAFGDDAIAAMKLEMDQKTKGLALMRAGVREVGWIDMQDEQGRFDPGWNLPGLPGWREMLLQGASWIPGSKAYGLSMDDKGAQSLSGMPFLDRSTRGITEEINRPFSEGGAASQPENPMARMVADAITGAMTDMFTRLDFAGAARRMGDAVVRMRGGPTLVPANEDR